MTDDELIAELRELANVRADDAGHIARRILPVVERLLSQIDGYATALETEYTRKKGLTERAERLSARVTELQAANTREVEARRKAESASTFVQLQNQTVITKAQRERIAELEREIERMRMSIHEESVDVGRNLESIVGRLKTLNRGASR